MSHLRQLFSLSRSIPTSSQKPADFEHPAASDSITSTKGGLLGLLSVPSAPLERAVPPIPQPRAETSAPSTSPPARPPPPSSPGGPAPPSGGRTPRRMTCVAEASVPTWLSPRGAPTEPDRRASQSPVPLRRHSSILFHGVSGYPQYYPGDVASTSSTAADEDTSSNLSFSRPFSDQTHSPRVPVRPNAQPPHYRTLGKAALRNREHPPKVLQKGAPGETEGKGEPCSPPAEDHPASSTTTPTSSDAPSTPSRSTEGFDRIMLRAGRVLSPRGSMREALPPDLPLGKATAASFRLPSSEAASNAGAVESAVSPRVPPLPDEQALISHSWGTMVPDPEGDHPDSGSTSSSDSDSDSPPESPTTSPPPASFPQPLASHTPPAGRHNACFTLSNLPQHQPPIYPSPRPSPRTPYPPAVQQHPPPVLPSPRPSPRAGPPNSPAGLQHPPPVLPSPRPSPRAGPPNSPAGLQHPPSIYPSPRPSPRTGPPHSQAVQQALRVLDLEAFPMSLSLSFDFRDRDPETSLPHTEGFVPRRPLACPKPPPHTPRDGSSSSRHTPRRPSPAHSPPGDNKDPKEQP